MNVTTVHVRLTDAATGQPTAARVRLTDREGNDCVPLGRLASFAYGRGEDVGGHLLHGGQKWFFVEGSFEVPLPAGEILVEARKGPEYHPLRQVVTLPAGKLALRLNMERVCDLRAEGWYSGDTWAHFVGADAALLEAAAEDVAVVHVLAHETTIPTSSGRPMPSLPNILEFSGQSWARERLGHGVAVNTLNTHAHLGRLALLNCHRPVYPLTFGSPGGVDDWALDEWCDQCHRKGGLVVGHGLFGSYGVPGELLAGLIHGKVDALEVGEALQGEPDALVPWERLLAVGIRPPLVGGSGKDCNRVPLGATRTYARLQPGEEFTFKAWIEAVRAGRTFVTTGPLIRLEVQGQSPGAQIELPPEAPAIPVHATLWNALPGATVEVVANGHVVACGPTVETEVRLPEGGWIAARCRGAHTSVVQIQVEGKRPTPEGRVLALLRSQLGAALTWVERAARCPTPRDRERLTNILSTAQARLDKTIA